MCASHSEPHHAQLTGVRHCIGAHAEVYDPKTDASSSVPMTSDGCIHLASAMTRQEHPESCILVQHMPETHRAASLVMVHSQSIMLSGRSGAAVNICQRLACCYHRCIWPLLAGCLLSTISLAVQRTTTYPGGLLAGNERLVYSHAQRLNE